MNQLIYSKFSTERAARFQIRTDILMENGKKVVRKVPQTRAAAVHTDNLKVYYELLSEDFAGSNLAINNCEKKDNSVYFEFAPGSSLEEQLDELLEAGELEKIVERMQQYFSVILQENKLEAFEETEAFREVFGHIELQGQKSRKTTDIDMIFSNIICDRDKYHLLDYEWTYCFPIPVKFVIYRCLHYYVLGSQKRAKLSLKDYYERFQISQEEQDTFAVMEENFQKYVNMGVLPMRAIMEEISPGSENLQMMIGNEYYMQVYRNYGAGFIESESERTDLDRTKLLIEKDIFLTPKICDLRIDPLAQRCIFEIQELSLDGVELEYTTNCIPLGENKYFSETYDPYIQVPIHVEKQCHLHIRFLLKQLDDFTVEYLQKVYSNPMQEHAVETEQLQQAPNEERSNQTDKQEEQPDMKKRSGKIIYNIDRIEKTQVEGRIFGWAFLDGEGEDLQISAVTKDNEPVETRIEKYNREDVNELYQLDKEYQTGFILHITLSEVKEGYVKVEFQSGDKKASSVHRNKEIWRSTYVDWIEAKIPNADEQLRQKQERFPRMPLISIVVPVYNTPTDFLKELIDSVQQQTYQNWELCLADASTKRYVRKIINKYAKKDSRIRYIQLKENKGISGNTNAAMEAAKGDWILFSDHDDALCVDALYEIVAKINEDEQIDAVYTDEDKMSGDGEIFFDPTCKTEYNLTMLRNYNYITHIFTIKRELMNEVGYLQAEYDGAQDYDFVLRCCEKAKKVGHVAKILYHWRAHMNSTAGNSDSKEYAYEAGRKAVEAHYKRLGIDAKVTFGELKGHYHTDFAIQGNPLVTILIPNKDQVDTLDTCIRSIEEKSTYTNYEILIVENNSEEQDTFDYYEKRTKQDERVRMIEWKEGFNYAAIHNFAVKYAKGEYLILLNNDVEIMSENWIESMLGYCQQEDVGIVGAKLIYPDDTVQHAGVIVGIGGIAGHIFYGAPKDSYGYCTWQSTSHEMSCVTAACLMTKKSVYEQIDGMDELFQVAYNDVDYCLKVREANYKVIYDADIWAYHYESKTRGYDTTPEKSERLKREANRLTTKWKEFLQKGDPYYNKNLTLEAADCALVPIDK